MDWRSFHFDKPYWIDIHYDRYTLHGDMLSMDFQSNQAGRNKQDVHQVSLGTWHLFHKDFLNILDLNEWTKN